MRSMEGGNLIGDISQQNICGHPLVVRGVVTLPTHQVLESARGRMVAAITAAAAAKDLVHSKV